MRGPRHLLARPPRFVRDLAILTGGQVVGKVIGLVVFAVLARTLDPAGYGAVEYVVGFAAFTAMAIKTVLKKKETTPCSRVVRRITVVRTCTSETWAVMPTTKE